MSIDLKGLILCAGNGKRLFPITKICPKPLVPIANKPSLYYAIQSMIEANITDIGLVIKEEQSDDVLQMINKYEFEVELKLIYQNEILGTGDAIKCASNFIGDSAFAVYLADNIYGEPIKHAIRLFLSDPSDAYVIVKKVENPSDYGVVQIKNKMVIDMQEKPEDPRSDYALTGLYLFGAGKIKEFFDLPFSPKGEIEMTTALKNMLIRGQRIKVYELNEWWVDIGVPEKTLAANRLKLQEINGNSISDSAALESSLIFPPVVIGDDCVIRNSVIGPNVSIADHCIIDNSKISNSIVYKNSYLTQMNFCNRIHVNHEISMKVEETDNKVLEKIGGHKTNARSENVIS
jgi:glucose-1-phosphate thymidylyltransferase